MGTVAAGHIHRGAAGKVGPIVVDFFAEPTRRPRGCVNGVSRSLIRDIERNPHRSYVNVHNKRYPAGAVRGQLRRVESHARAQGRRGPSETVEV